MADGLYCKKCGYNETEHQYKNYVPGYSDGTLPKKDWPCDNFRPDRKEQKQINKEKEEEVAIKQEYMDFHEEGAPLGSIPVIVRGFKN